MNSDAHLYDETTDSDEEDILNEYPDRTASTRSQSNELFLHLTDALARAGKRDPARAEITGDPPSVEKIIARDVNHFNDMLPPYVRTRKSWTNSRSAFLCDEANKVTTQEITIEPRAYRGGSGGGCYYRVWLGHQHGEDQAIFARSKVPPNHHRQNALHNKRTESSTSKHFGHLEGSIETPEMATANRSVNNKSTTMEKFSNSACDRVNPTFSRLPSANPNASGQLMARMQSRFAQVDLKPPRKGTTDLTILAAISIQPQGKIPSVSVSRRL
ncbi:MAG: hypothetical protein Q9197_001872 [Variospora fuerteventurae]